MKGSFKIAFRWRHMNPQRRVRYDTTSCIAFESIKPMNCPSVWHGAALVRGSVPGDMHGSRFANSKIEQQNRDVNMKRHSFQLCSGGAIVVGASKTCGRGEE